MNENQENYSYNKRDIYLCIQEMIEIHVLEPSLKKLAHEAIMYKQKEFLFSRLTYSHYLIWEEPKEVKNMIKVMASVEVFVLLCDILDDLQDMDSFDVPWMKVESKFALNLTLLFHTLYKKLILETTFSPQKKIYLMEIFDKHELRSLSGQHADLKQEIVGEDEYVDIMQNKSGSFVALACLLGSSNASYKEQECIEQYAYFIGCSAQIENDLLGIKERYNFKDIVAKSYSLPILYLLHYKKEEFSLLFEYYHADTIGETELIPYLMKNKMKIEESGAIAYSRSMQLIYTQKAIALIDDLYEEEADKESIKKVFLKRI